MATRSQIREAIRAIAEPAGFSTTFNYSPAQIFEDELPALKVFFNSGETEYDFEYICGHIQSSIISDTF